MIQVTLKDSGKAESFLQKMLNASQKVNLDKYGEMGVQALREGTPKDSGKTADSWRYEISRGSDQITISWFNDNIVQYVNVAVIIQYGHGTKGGGWVAGRDYINPAMAPIFDSIADKLFAEVSR